MANQADKIIQQIRISVPQLREIRSKSLRYVANAAIRMKDANFAAQGFVVNGVASPKWQRRKRETRLSAGRRILHGIGLLQNSVKAQIYGNKITVGVDLAKVPYAQVHNEGGTIIQNVPAHTRRNPRNGKTQRVKAHRRVINMPQRKFLGFSPDIMKIAEKNIAATIHKTLK